MSFEAMHKVRASGLSDRTQVDVLEALAFFLNQETGACFPSTESIARISRVNDRLVRTTLKALHDLGYVSSIQTPGQRRYFTLHLDKLPTAEPLKESTPLEEPTPPNKNTPLYKTTPLHESTGEGCMKVQGTPVEKCSTPLYETTPEQGNNKEINKIKNKVCIAPSTEPLENLVKDTPENGTTQKRDDSSTKNGPVTGNKNREIEQVIETHDDALSESTPPKTRAKKGEAWKKWIKVEKPAEVPDDLWKQFGEIRALKKMALTERALELLRSEGEKARMTLLQVVETCCGNGWAGFKASWLSKVNGNNYRMPQNVTQTLEYRERLQACCRGEGRAEKLADDGVTIIVD